MINFSGVSSSKLAGRAMRLPLRLIPDSAVEPVPRNLELLRRHVEMNRYQNVRILPCALGDFDGKTRFDLGPDASMGHMATGGWRCPVRGRTPCLPQVRSKHRM